MTGLPLVPARLASELRGQADWTQLWHGRLEPDPDPCQPPWFHPFAFSGRLKAMADSQAIASLPEGKDHLPAGTLVLVQRLGPCVD